MYGQQIIFNKLDSHNLIIYHTSTNLIINSITLALVNIIVYIAQISIPFKNSNKKMGSAVYHDTSRC